MGQGYLSAFLIEVDPAFYGVPSARYEAACASSSVAIDAAAMKIRTDECDIAIVNGRELMKAVNSKLGDDFPGRLPATKRKAKALNCCSRSCLDGLRMKHWKSTLSWIRNVIWRR